MRSALTLAAFDLAATAAVLGLALWFREVLAPAWFGIAAFSPAASYVTLWPVVVGTVAVRAAFGLYPGHGVGEVTQLRQQTLATALLAVTVLAGGALFRFNETYSRLVLLTWFSGLVVVLPLMRAWMRSVLARFDWFGIPVDIVASTPSSTSLMDALRDRPSFGLRPATHGEAVSAALLHVDEVDGRVWDALATRYARVWVVTHTWIAAVPSSVTEIDGRVALELRARLLEPINRIIKRLLDISLSLLAAPVVLVVAGVAAVAIRFEGPGPILVAHARIGREGRPIRVWKFRTMVPDAPARLAEVLEADPMLAEEWARKQKLRNDPRVTRVGRLLRRSSLDELPQAWNVLIGEMSWVGPRPIVAEELERYGPLRDLYLRVVPGITGLVQVSGRSDLEYDRRVEIDGYYVRNWSIWLDLVVLARTVDAVVRGRGAL